MRKVKDKYIFIYSSMLPEGAFGLHRCNYNLAWAYSESPLGPFTYGGILIDARARDRDPQTGKTICTAHPYGNTHGSICEINGQWWVFFHRQTGTDEYARQAMVAPISVEVEEGPGGKVRISEAEYTSEGFCIEGLNPLREMAAGWACYLIEPQGVVQEYPYFHHSGSYVRATRLDSPETPETLSPPFKGGREGLLCPVVNNTAGSVVGYKYLNMNLTHGARNLRLKAHIKPQGVDGRIRVMLGAPTRKQGGTEIGKILISSASRQEKRDYQIAVPKAASFSGKQPLFFVFESQTTGVSIGELYDFQFEAGKRQQRIRPISQD